MTVVNRGLCRVCGSTLQPILAEGKRGVRCSKPLCPFNFDDQQCPTCGKPVVKAEHPELGRYVVECENGHSWNVLA